MVNECCCGGSKNPEHEYEKFEHGMKKEKNKLDHNDILLCAACFLNLESVGIVNRYAPGRKFNVCQLPRPQNEQNDQKMNIFQKVSDCSKITWNLSGMMFF